MNEAFRLYVCGYGSLCHTSLKIINDKHNKNEAFHLYVFRGAYIGCQSLKILCYKLNKHEIFYIYESEVGILSWVLPKIHSWKIHECNLLAFHLYVSKNGYSGFSFQKILFTYFTKLRLFTCLYLNMAWLFRHIFSKPFDA